mgnify:CR=1 FL=1
MIIKRNAKLLSVDAYFYAFLSMSLSVYMFTDIGFHKWHGSHLTPHILGVSLNLSESNLLCNFLADGCDSYHRHPPLYFYINLFLAKLSWNAASYVTYAMTLSVILNYIGVFLLMRLYGRDNYERLMILFLSVTSLFFVVNLTLSTYDSFIVLIFSMFAFSEKENSNITAYLSIFLAMTLSWYFIVAGSIYTCYKLYNRNYQVLYPYIAGLFITGYFLMNGSDYFYDNFVSATQNIDFSSNINTERVYSFSETTKMVVVNLLYIVSPVGLIIGLFGLNKYRTFRKLLFSQPIYVYFPLIVFLVWNTVFFRWSLIHNFIYLMLIPFLTPLYIEFLRLLSRGSKAFVAGVSLLIIVLQHGSVIGDYDNLSVYDNVGVEIFTEALLRYGYSDN